MQGFWNDLRHTTYQDLTASTSLSTTEQAASIIIDRSTIYSAKRCSLVFTTYDVCRGQDSIVLDEHCDVMVASNNSNGAHPFWYGRIVGLYHFNARVRTSREWTRIQLARVRWFEPVLPTEGRRTVRPDQPVLVRAQLTS